MLRPHPGLILIYCSEVHGFGEAHNSLQKVCEGQEAIAQAGHPRWPWLSGLTQVKVKTSAVRPPSKAPHRLLGRGQRVGHPQTCSAKDQRAHHALHPVLFHYVCQGNPAYLAIGYWQHSEERCAVSQRLCFKRDVSPQNSNGLLEGGEGLERGGE